MLATVEEMTEKKLIVRLENGELLDVPAYSWENARYRLNEDTGDTEPDIQGVSSTSLSAWRGRSRYTRVRG